MAYIKFSDIPFLNKKHKETCEALLRDINRLETQCLFDEEFIDYVRRSSGESAAIMLAKGTSIQFKTLSALRISFWYYTGYDPSRVIMEPRKEETVNIFNPLGELDA
jgi:hypothetical protein